VEKRAENNELTDMQAFIYCQANLLEKCY